MSSLAGTIFVEPQSGHRVDIDRYLGSAVMSATRLVRVDNASMDASLLKYAVKSK